MENFLLKLTCNIVVVILQNYLVYGTNVIRGNTASLDCFIPTIVDQHDSFYVDVAFQQSSSNKIQIASYDAKSSKTIEKSSQFQGRLIFLNSGQMDVLFVGLRDEGTYTCHSRSFGLDDVKEISTITVYVPPTVEVKKPSVPLVVSSSLAEAAECIANEGKPPAKVHWSNSLNLDFSEDIVDDSSSSSKLSTVTSTLQLQPIKLHNQQSFTCTVDHPAFAESSVKVIYLNVTYPPSTPIIMVDNNNEYLTCDAEGNPPTKYKWSMPEGAPSKTMFGKRVQLVEPNNPVHRNDTYVCSVSNGIGEPQSKSITTSAAMTAFALTNQANITAIIGGVIGGVAALCLLIGVVYFFVVRKNSEKDVGPYQQHASLVGYNTEGYGRSSIHHSNSTLVKRYPSSHRGTAMGEKSDGNFRSSSTSDSEDEGQHDIDLETDPATTLVHPAPHDDPDSGITRTLSSFRTRPQLRSTSPGSRKGRPDSQGSREADNISPTPAPRQSNRYDFPPGDTMEMTNPNAGMGDHLEPVYESDAYPFQQPSHIGYPERQQSIPRRTDSLPQYEPKYAKIDHSAYRKGSGSRRTPMEEPVEYAQIRHGTSHVV